MRCTPIILLMLFLSKASFPLANAHGIGPIGAQPLNWHTRQISHVFSINSHPAGRTRSINGENCLAGRNFNFAVRNEYAFDIDDDVNLEIELYPAKSARQISVSYDESTLGRKIISLDIPESATGTDKIRINTQLQRARFYDAHPYSTDFAISTNDEMDFVICTITLRKTPTKASGPHGYISLSIMDENGNPTPARVGIYDSSGKIPLPSNEAVPVKHFEDVIRLVYAPVGPKLWPSGNHLGFYVDGTYHAKLPTGKYKIISIKGPEYHFSSGEFEILEGKTSDIQLRMRRWENMSARKWFSGDGHIHYIRSNPEDDKTLLSILQAEDINVGNILQMGNMGEEHFRQYKWHPTQGKKKNFVVAPGQEEPRTIRMGHAIQLNVKSPTRDTENYFLYDRVLAKSRDLGAVTGFAHVWDDLSFHDGIGHRRGLALNVPLGLVDFVEVLQGSVGNTRSWFDYLNLGYKLTPLAGTDYPYGDWPGGVRNYVFVETDFSPQAWFDALRAGKVFVTNGPMIEFDINGSGMGSELNVKAADRLTITAKAKINPNIDQIGRLELIEQGQVIKTATASGETEELSIEHEISALKGTWFIVRAYGKRSTEKSNIVAMSAPIYVRVNGQSFWKPTEVPEIVSRIKADLESALNPNHLEFSEGWDIDTPLRKFSAPQQPLIQERVNKALKAYEDLVRRAAGSSLAADNPSK